MSEIGWALSVIYVAGCVVRVGMLALGEFLPEARRQGYSAGEAWQAFGWGVLAWPYLVLFSRR